MVSGLRIIVLFLCHPSFHPGNSLLSSLDPLWFRQHVAMVGQEPVLFAYTIAENIAYGRQATREEVTIRMMLVSTLGWVLHYGFQGVAHLGSHRYGSTLLFAHETRIMSLTLRHQCIVVLQGAILDTDCDWHAMVYC